MNERIKQVRKYYNLPMDKFGERIGITKSSVSLLESGKNNPSDQTLKLICREFNVSYDWLMDGVGDMLQQTDEDDDVNRLMLTGSDFAKTVFRTLAKMPPELWTAFEEFVARLKSEQQQKDGQ